MKPAALSLTRAILTELQGRGLPVGKTKLLKLLYVADIEHFRSTGETLTGFDWVFFLYGPWAADYDEVLNQLQAEDSIARRSWSATDLDGEEIRVRDQIELGSVISNTIEYFHTRRLIDTLGALATAEVLDWVYFRTEPMQDAEKMKRLDFGKISKERPRFYRRRSSGTTSKQMRKLREEFRELRTHLEAESQASLQKFIEPTIDEPYIRALEVMNSLGAE